ncbi:hypothetical protein ITP53_32670 [Nonomuraea sp. K274]|uniref:Uncharacterized protein n=1 Tax=Nonomuraea cypriaca TaxID=1187855 RepID=A0A931AH54_9ACTN|nr:hypothetical protein [Nonomuraea cypriaca]MBF8190383.1 hypothetical protein [Nonomuraea cypriaca]
MRFDGVFIMFSELSPDGRTVAAVDFPELKNNQITLLDAKTGRTLRKVPIRGLPRTASVNGTATWPNRSEVTVVVNDSGRMYTYAVDVGTGRARRSAHYAVQMNNTVTLPGVGYSW